MYFIKCKTYATLLHCKSGYRNLHSCECASLTDVRTTSEFNQSELSNALITHRSHTELCKFTAVVVDVALYKQHRSIEKVNCPWLMTKNNVKSKATAHGGRRGKAPTHT
jgi:hypothetical protein